MLLSHQTIRFKTVEATNLQHIVQSSQRLDKDISTFVAEFIPACGKSVESLVKIEIHVSIEVTTNEVMDLLLVLSMEILEFMKGGKLDDIQSVGCQDVRLSLEKVLCL